MFSHIYYIYYSILFCSFEQNHCYSMFITNFSHKQYMYKIHFNNVLKVVMPDAKCGITKKKKKIAR